MSTEAGPKASRPVYSDDLIDAINTVFTQFEVAFPNLYNRAYSSDNAIMLAKQLWANSLQEFSGEQILRACQKAIESSDFIPTIHNVLSHCRQDLSSYGLPSPRDAYIEACNASEPRAEFSWSHPAVYFAGRDAGWFFLSSNIESKAMPVFEAAYRKVCDRVLAGEKLAMPNAQRLPSETATPLSAEEKVQRMAALRKEIGL
ncbi:MAG TPA: replication protein P [Pseudomonadales bacterium]|nr:replication protein P [Pseudomonadales bacterium]